MKCNMIIMNKFRWQLSAFPLFQARQLTGGQHRVSAQENYFERPRFLHCLLKVFLPYISVISSTICAYSIQGHFFSRQWKPTRSISGRRHVSRVFHPWHIFIWGWYYSEFSYASITFWFGSDMLSVGFPYAALPNKGFSRISRRREFSARSQIRTHSFSYAHIYDRVCLSFCPHNVCINNQYCLSNGIFPVSSSLWFRLAKVECKLNINFALKTDTFRITCEI